MSGYTQSMHYISNDAARFWLRCRDTSVDIRYRLSRTGGFDTGTGGCCMLGHATHAETLRVKTARNSTDVAGFCHLCTKVEYAALSLFRSR